MNQTNDRFASEVGRVASDVGRVVYVVGRVLVFGVVVVEVLLDDFPFPSIVYGKIGENFGRLADAGGLVLPSGYEISLL